MYRPLRSLTFRYLSRAGFLVPAPKPQRSEKCKPLWNALRHPLTLVIVGFVLTGLVGTALQSRYQENEKAKAAATKSMDELRGSLDGMGSAMDHYVIRAERLVFVMENQSDRSSIQAAVGQYDEAYAQWLAAADNATGRILGLFPIGGSDASVAQNFIANLEIALQRFDECISDALGGYHYRNHLPSVACRINSQQPIPAESWMDSIVICARLFTYYMRPDPRDDYEPAKQIRDVEDSLKKKITPYCSRSALSIK
jgi:hypothetical protein